MPKLQDLNAAKEKRWKKKSQKCLISIEKGKGRSIRGKIERHNGGGNDGGIRLSFYERVNNKTPLKRQVTQEQMKKKK